MSFNYTSPTTHELSLFHVYFVNRTSNSITIPLQSAINSGEIWFLSDLPHLSPPLPSLFLSSPPRVIKWRGPHDLCRTHGNKLINLLYESSLNALIASRSTFRLHVPRIWFCFPSSLYISISVYFNSRQLELHTTINIHDLEI